MQYATNQYEGMIAERGKHDELIQSRGIYSKLVTMQEMR